MYIFHFLVKSLIIFEALLKQSDAVGSTKNSPKQTDDDVKLPYELIGSILHKAGLKATKGAGQSRALIAGSRAGISRIFEDRILLIHSYTTPYQSVEAQERYKYEKGEFYFDFGSYRRLMSLFESFGEHARRIFLNYHDMNVTIRRNINKNIINKYAKYFTELRLHFEDDSGIWEEMSNEDGQIQFLNVKKFDFMCASAKSRRKSFDLNTIFPKLESFKLIGYINYPNCLENVTNLKELTLLFTSIPELQYGDIFAKNKQISKLSISPKKTETLQSIEKYLKNLKRLKIRNAGIEFLFGGDRVYNLTSITSFVVGIDGRSQLRGGLSFKMPNLKRLIIRGLYIAQKLHDFINHFETLDTVEIHQRIVTSVNSALYGIDQMIYVKEFISTYFCNQLKLLENFFKTFDKTTSKLNSIKLICIGNIKNDDSKEIMNEINVHLMETNRPTWTLTEVVENETNTNYLMIKRNP